MKLPLREKAFISSRKLKSYLLSEIHAVGRLKAKYFKTLGYDLSNLDLLKQEIFEIAQNEEVVKTVTIIYGQKYIIDGNIETSENKLSKLRTVCIINKYGNRPRFVTAYPV